MRNILNLTLLCGLSTSAFAYTDVDGSTAKLGELEVKLLKSTLSFQLFDAESAQIRDFKLGPMMKGCGLLNARTSGGGYGGFRQFAVDLPRGLLRTARSIGGRISQTEFIGSADPICTNLGF